METGKRYVLLVDDEPNITNSIRRELADWAEERDLEIVTAQSGPIGLNILETKASSTVIVVSDLRMPEMKGSDFLLAVKAKYPHIVSILLTGYSETEEIIKAVTAGIFSFMLKPWETAYLLSEVQKAFDHGESLRKNAEYRKTVEEELRWAGEMQKALLKPNIPQSDKVEFRVSYRPVRGLYCGGDYYDVIFLGSDRYLLLVGDVAGHGVKAAFITGILKAVIFPEYVRGAIGKDFSPGAFLSWLNERMSFEFRGAAGMVLTFFAGVLDLRNSFFKYANAGHDHPFLLRGGAAIELPVSGTGIGFVKSVLYPEQSVSIASGDQLLLYTDGLVEIDCRAEKELVRLQPLLVAVERGDDYHRRLLGAALAEAEASDFTDDVTLLTASVV
ncbi:MAG: fused response regulator/phosphatase [Spirochaetes bacterium]|nr:fused response regulator/phosphatase [Spirochaetota bacterium]MBU1080394.1 fused response regulator/phosphatase [Spirochaetota bacterium]